ncbi:MAG: two-component regulator propeller domain-containing protein [Bacteroidota bacterium]
MKSTFNLKFSIILSFGFLLLIAKPSFAQYFLWDNHLCTTNITGIEQEGNIMWLATHGGGLLKYDQITGNTVFFNKHNSAIPTVMLTVIAIDSLGNKWIGTDDGTTGLMCYNGTTWTCYNTLNSPLPSNIIQSILFKGGILWVGTKMGLARFDGTSWTVFTLVTYGMNTYPVHNVKDIAIDSTAKLWICCDQIALMKFDGLNWTIYNSTTVPLFMSLNSYNCVTIDKYGNIWCGGAPSVYKFNGSIWTMFANPTGVALGHAQDIKADTSGNIWLLSVGNYLVHYDGVNWLYNGIGANPPFQIPVSVPGPITGKIYLDNNNSVWVGLWFGLAKYNGSWIDYTPAIHSDLTAGGISSVNYIPSSQSFSIGEFFNSFYDSYYPPSFPGFFVGSGLTIFDGINWNQFDVNDSCHQYSCLYSLNSRPSDIWMGISNGIAHYDGSVFTKHFWNTPCSAYELTLAIARDNNAVYTGTDKGHIYKYNGLFWSSLSTPLSLISPVNTLVLKENFLFAGSQMGLLQYDTASTTSFVFNTSNSPLASDTINDILPGKPLWIATDRGLVSTDLSLWTTYNTSNSGIPSNMISCITKDSLQNIWLGTKGYGVAMFDGNNFTVYNTANSGLTDNYITDIVTDDDNNIWIGTYDGGLCTFKYGLWLSENQSLQNSWKKDNPAMTISPNPFQTTTKIHISLNHPGEASLCIFNSLGQQIKTFFTDKACPEKFDIFWDGNNDAGMKVCPGVYFCSLVFDGRNESERIVIVR